MRPPKKLIIIGAGPGGYTAAFVAADAGLDVTLIDERPVPGGVCLNEGCIPVKTLLNASHHITAAKEAAQFGITFSAPTIDLPKLNTWKTTVTDKLTSGLAILCKQRGVEFIQGKASFLSNSELQIASASGKNEQLTFTHAIIACGSEPIEFKDIPSSPRIMDPTSALVIDDIPDTMLVIGGGYVGLEIGSIYAHLGTKVSVVEMLPQLLGGTDTDLVSVLQRRLQKLFQSIMTGSTITRIELKDGKPEVEIENAKGQKSVQRFDKVLVSIGRKPNTGSLGLNNVHIALDEKGFIKIDAGRRTAEPNIYAIGDVTGQPMLAHKASHEARVAVHNILGKENTFTPSCIPAVVFTDPEIAYCGLTEKQAKDQNIDVKIAKFPWAASGRAMTLDRTEGFTKLLTDPATNKILGGAIVGIHAGEMISEIALAIEAGLDASALRHTIHPHPTLSETIMETADVLFGECVHINQKRHGSRDS